jgi:hypothetical protein
MYLSTYRAIICCLDSTEELLWESIGRHKVLQKKLELINYHACKIRANKFSHHFIFRVILTTNVLYGVAFDNTTDECNSVPSAKATYRFSIP